MSCICGIVDFEKKTADFTVLREMGRAMTLRGGDDIDAYVSGGVGLLCVQRLASEFDYRQPYTKSQNGRSYTVIIDGDMVFKEKDTKPIPERVIDCYLSFGIDCFSSFDGDFAVAICDEFKGELILARSRGALRPLFCCKRGTGIAFASEIKGLLRAMGEIRVDSDSLCEHILSPMGSFRASDIYLDIDEIEAGQTAIFSRVGATVIPCPSMSMSDGAFKGSDIVIPKISEGENVRHYLAEALFCFDYPQFDCFMPGDIDALKIMRAKRSAAVRIADGTAGADSEYTRARAERLGSYCGVNAMPIAPPSDYGREKSFKGLASALERELDSIDGQVLNMLFDGDIISKIRRERSAFLRIRAMGMVCQSVMWVKNTPLALCKASGV